MFEYYYMFTAYCCSLHDVTTINMEITKSKSTIAVACFLPGRAKDLSAPLYMTGGADKLWIHICVMIFHLQGTV